jgi:hypothetical protein
MDIRMQPENMPYYQGPGVRSPYDSQGPAVNEAANSLLTMIVTQERNGSPCLANYPVWFGKFSLLHNTAIWPLYNLEYPVFAFQAACFNWAVYSFNSGHFALTMSKRNLPFDILLACNPYAYGCALFDEFTECPCILPSAAALLDHICRSGDQSLINGYISSIHIVIK